LGGLHILFSLPQRAFGKAHLTLAKLMETTPSQSVPPIIAAPPVLPQRAMQFPQAAVPPLKGSSAPTLYAIIIFKLLTGALLILAAFVLYNMAGTDLRQEFTRMIQESNLDPDGQMFSQVTHWLDSVTPAYVKMFATGTILFGLLSLVEGAGLVFRASWAGWLVILESAVFIPIEIYQVAREFTWMLLAVLVLNILSVWYLWACRRRLFRGPFPS
jgi:uncharacterized membrane protein (DUF2068 family)